MLLFSQAFILSYFFYLYASVIVAPLSSLNAISLVPLFNRNKSVAPPLDMVSGCFVNGLTPVIVCPNSAWYSDSPAAPSAVLIGTMTACCIPAFVICAAIRLTLSLGRQ